MIIHAPLFWCIVKLTNSQTLPAQAAFCGRREQTMLLWISTCPDPDLFVKGGLRAWRCFSEKKHSTFLDKRIQLCQTSAACVLWSSARRGCSIESGTVEFKQGEKLKMLGPVLPYHLAGLGFLRPLSMEGTCLSVCLFVYLSVCPSYFFLYPYFY